MSSSDGGARACRRAPGARTRGAPRGARDAGFVTAEAAVVLPVLVAVVAALSGG